MHFLAWLLEFCTAFYSTYTTSGDNDSFDVSTTTTTASLVVGVPNVAIIKDDAQFLKATTNYVESLSAKELKQLSDRLENFNYQDANLDDFNKADLKTIK